MEMMTFSAKTVEDAVTKALIELETTSDKLEYEVVEKSSDAGSVSPIRRGKEHYDYHRHG